MKVETSPSGDNILNVDTEKIGYLLQDAVIHSTNGRETVEYVTGKEWSNEEKASVLMAYGMSLHLNEYFRTQYGILFEMSRDFEINNPHPTLVTSSEEEKVSVLTTFTTAAAIIKAAAELECEPKSYVIVGLLIAEIDEEDKV